MKVLFALGGALLALTLTLDAQSTGVREIAATDQNVVTLNTRLRFSTMIILPDGEEILDTMGGDGAFFIVNASHNLAQVKPTKEGAESNIHFVTASGAVYSFLLQESTAPPDLKVYVTSTRTRAAASVAARPRYYTADQVGVLETELAGVKAANALALQMKDQAVSTIKTSYPATLKFPFQPILYTRPFYIASAWQDDQFTYFRTDARELPTLYEELDGQPALLNFTVPRQGLYVVKKLVDRGYFQLGKKTLHFAVRDDD